MNSLLLFTLTITASQAFIFTPAFHPLSHSKKTLAHPLISSKLFARVQDLPPDDDKFGGSTKCESGEEEICWDDGNDGGEFQIIWFDETSVVHKFIHQTCIIQGASR